MFSTLSTKIRHMSSMPCHERARHSACALQDVVALQGPEGKLSSFFAPASVSPEKNKEEAWRLLHFCIFLLVSSFPKSLCVCVCVCKYIHIYIYTVYIYICEFLFLLVLRRTDSISFYWGKETESRFFWPYRQFTMLQQVFLDSLGGLGSRSSRVGE